MCFLRGCVVLIVFILSIFVFFLGGSVGKYYYYRHHTDFTADDVLWLYKNNETFFSMDKQFLLWGILAVVIFIINFCLALAVLQVAGICFCFAAKSPFKLAKCICIRATKKSKSKEQSKSNKNKSKSKKNKRKLNEDEEEDEEEEDI